MAYNNDYEIEISDDSEATTTDVESSSFRDKPATTTNIKEKRMSSSKSKSYSIPCSNAFTEGVFNHMKHAWTPSRNSMAVETVAAELQIRLNCQMKCNDVFFIRTK